MFSQTKLAFVGGGTMAEAIIKCILEKGLVSPESIMASDMLPQRGRFLSERYGIETTTDNREAVRWGEIVVLAIKPQVLPQVLPELSGLFRKDQLILSIVAGATVGTIAQGFLHGTIVRVMPNTPAQIGEGMSVWIATSQVSETQKAQAQAILQALGEEIEVHAERYIDVATALNGSGPAYVFLILEALTDSAVYLGLSRADAKKLIIQTVLGSTLFAKQSDLHLAELRNMVTSPGGTTVEALQVMEKGGLRAILTDAVRAAYEKSIRLGEMAKEKD